VEGRTFAMRRAKSIVMDTILLNQT